MDHEIIPNELTLTAAATSTGGPGQAGQGDRPDLAGLRRRRPLAARIRTISSRHHGRSVRRCDGLRAGYARAPAGGQPDFRLGGG